MTDRPEAGEPEPDSFFRPDGAQHAGAEPLSSVCAALSTQQGRAQRPMPLRLRKEIQTLLRSRLIASPTDPCGQKAAYADPTAARCAPSADHSDRG